MESEILYIRFYKTLLRINVSVSEGGRSCLIKEMSNTLSITKHRSTGTGNHFDYFICIISAVNSISKFYLL